MTSKVFGEGSLLTGHRLLRLGSVRVGQGQLGEAAGLLQRALKVRVWGRDGRGGARGEKWGGVGTGEGEGGSER